MAFVHSPLVFVLYILACQFYHVDAATTTWESFPSHPTMPGTAPNCSKWYTAKKGDNCFVVHRMYGISFQDFIMWNPAVSLDCTKGFLEGYSYCVGVDASKSTPTATSNSISSETTVTNPSGSATTSSEAHPSSLTSSIPSTYTFTNPITTSWDVTIPPRETAWPPTKTLEGQPTSCIKWHEVMMRDTCDSIEARYSSWMTREEFMKWNPGLSEECPYPLVGYWLCVMVRPSDSAIAFPTAITNMSIPTPTMYTPPSVACPGITKFESKPSPVQTGIAIACQNYYKATTDDSCSKIIKKYNYISEEQLKAWNPALGADCKGLRPSYYYCVAAFPSGSLPMPPTVTTAPTPTHTGITSDCKAWYRREDHDLCSDIAQYFGTFSEEEFKKWNPAVGHRCEGLINGHWYCVAVPGTPSTRTSIPLFPTSIPRQPNVAKNCTRWWHVSPQEDCYSIALRNRIRPEDLFAWNPDVKDCRRLPVDHEICVGVNPITTSDPCAPPTSTPIGDTTTVSLPPRPTVTGTVSTNSTKASITSSSTPCPTSTGVSKTTKTLTTPSLPCPPGKNSTETVTIQEHQNDYHHHHYGQLHKLYLFSQRFYFHYAQNPLNSDPFHCNNPYDNSHAL
ncbi:hypothetical protein BDV25DRAFT_138471 [Aspergillus avenaceus]|uniref:LysM domain-containing protein n=1 Tax=Aspergillus avenaceus TaxID=36643 RepID=A0A5N6TZS5_ASPAV|nr:hypothetical protein BDV25DRAFT_138471 [Aspergillus avenaceus]